MEQFTGQVRSTPDDWRCALRLARKSGKKWLVDLDLLGYMLALEGDSIVKLPDNDEHLAKIRKEAGITQTDQRHGTGRPNKNAARDVKIWRLIKAGYSYSYIAKECECTKNAVSGVVGQHRRMTGDHTDYVMQQIAALHEEGTSIRDIADFLGFSTRMVQAKLTAYQHQKEAAHE